MLIAEIPDYDIPTLQASNSLSLSICPFLEIEGNTFYFYALYLWFQVTFKNGGECIGDLSDSASTCSSTCSKDRSKKFIPTQIKVFQLFKPHAILIGTALDIEYYN